MSVPPDIVDTDFLVLGSGSAGLTAALTAAVGGLAVTVLEKAEVLGGTSAMSGAGTWIPANHHAKAAGIEDSEEEALTYIRAAAPEGWAETEDALWQRFVSAAPEMLRFVEAHSPLRFALTPEPDPLRDLPGAKKRGRMLSPLPLSRWKAGPFARRIRASTIPELFTYHEAVETDLYHHPIRTTFELLPRLAWRVLTNARGKGTALMTGLIAGCLNKGVTIMPGTRALSLTQDDDGAVTGVMAEREGRQVHYRAKRGVLIATGGFEWDPSLLAENFPGPVDYLGSPDTNTGDGQRMAAAIGAELAHMDQATLTPSIPKRYQGKVLAMPVPFHTEPNAILVNREGQRFVNELRFNIGEFIDQRDSNGAPIHLPAWVISDAHMLENLPLVRWAARHDKSWLRQARTVEALASQIGLDPATLAETVSRFNAAVMAGEDRDFGRPAKKDAAAGADKRRRAGLDPIIHPPFLAMPFNRSILATKGGPRTNAEAEVLRPDGSVIPGLFCAGVAMANPLGTRSVGTGTTIGPNMAWGYVAARRALGLSGGGSVAGDGR
ncbi:FAD-dependent oxidoreductase [Acetobacteraceae bacterium H6797]|nr:FAD-dependent oxidoreductase [Acetobacteraceae bacterium H6797]